MDYFDGISFAPTLLGQEGQKKHDSCIGNLMKPIRLVYVWETGRW